MIYFVQVPITFVYMATVPTTSLKIMPTNNVSAYASTISSMPLRINIKVKVPEKVKKDVFKYCSKRGIKDNPYLCGLKKESENVLVS